VVEMRDSVIRFTGSEDVGSEGIFLNNIWTTEPIEPGASYRVVARLGDGPLSEALVTIPPAYEIEVLRPPRGMPVPDSLRLTGLDHVAFVVSIAHYVNDCGAATARRFHPTGAPEGKVRTIMIFPAPLQSAPGCGPTEILRQELWIVGSGTEWPSGPEYSISRLGVPDAPTSVTHAVGFVGGVLTRLILYEDCHLEGGPSAFCVLRYDDSTATVRGSVLDARCGAQPVTGATLQLRELDPGPGGRRRVRTARSDSSGEFEISALESGRRHELTVTRGGGTEGGVMVPDYTAYSDTLAFAPGEQVTYHVPLQRVGPC
jgi:hypothetical protein